MVQVRELVFKVNQQYIQSAAQDDGYRTEPAFRLQGSYRNMNKLAEKITPVMNDQEMQQMLADRSEEHTSELQSPCNLVCRLLLEKKKKKKTIYSGVRTKIGISSTCTTS